MLQHQKAIQKTLDFNIKKSLKALFVAVATVNSDCTVLQRARHVDGSKLSFGLCKSFYTFLMGQVAFLHIFFIFKAITTIFTPMNRHW